MLQYTAQKEAEEEAPKAANGTAAAAADGEAVDEDGKPVSNEMASMLAVDSKRAATAAIRAQVRGVHGSRVLGFEVWRFEVSKFEQNPSGSGQQEGGNSSHQGSGEGF
jgi:hypothetical protein